MSEEDTAKGIKFIRKYFYEKSFDA